MAVQAPFDLGHEVFRQPQVIEGLLEGLGGVLRLAALSRFETAALSSFGLFLAYRCVGDMLRPFVSRGSLAVAVWASACDTCPLTSVRTPSLMCHALPGLPAFFCML